MEIYLNYITFKEIVNKKDLVWNYIDDINKYIIFSSENNVIYMTEIYKSCNNIIGINETENNNNKSDFESNYKDNANDQNSLLLSPFTKNSVELKAEGKYDTITKETSQNIDFKIENGNKLIHGAIFYAKDAEIGDYVSAKVIDIDNILGYGAGTILKEWIVKWYVIPNQQMKITQDSAGEVLEGLYLRLSYTSVGTVNDVKVLVNYYLSVK